MKQNKETKRKVQTGKTELRAKGNKQKEDADQSDQAENRRTNKETQNQINLIWTRSQEYM